MIPELVVSWIVIGAVAGLSVFLFSSRRLRGGIVGNLMVGMIGALVGGYLVTAATHADVMRSTLTWGILVTSAVSAVILGVIMQSQSAPRVEPARKRSSTGP